MKEITLTINGREVKGKVGDTVLDVCQANGVAVPTLCHLDGLTDVGACRLCVVEIEKERRPVPACTYPARDGLVIRTNTEKLEKYRRQLLELIFTEGNHYCMFCEASGDCELQNLGYLYQMDHVRYPYAFPARKVDSLSEYMVIDHNRCILCGRCIRACSEVSGVDALSFSQRGWKTKVAADMDKPLGESTCRFVGACSQACPTGAIFEKLSIYKGIDKDCQKIASVCSQCGIGCEIDVLVRDNNLVKVESPALSGPRGGLCRIGRFNLLKQTPPRILSPMIRNKQGKLEATTWDRAAETIAARLSGSKNAVGGIVSARLPDETLSSFKNFMAEVATADATDTIDGAKYRKIAAGIKQFGDDGKGMDIESPLESILEADCVMVVGADPDSTNPVASSLIRRAVHEKNAKLIVIDAASNAFSLRTDLWLKPKAGSEGAVLSGLIKTIVNKGLAKASGESVPDTNSGTARSTGVKATDLEVAAEMYGKAKNAVIVYGERLLENGGASEIASILTLAKVTGNVADGRLRVISLKPEINSRGAWQMGLAKGIKPNTKIFYLLLADQPVSEELVSQIRGADFLVAQASYESPVTAMADVVLPSLMWAEREGSCVTMDGRVVKLERVLQPQDGLLQDGEVLKRIYRKLGSPQKKN